MVTSIESIESKILNEYPELVLARDEPVTITDDMQRIAWSITPRGLFDAAIEELFAANIPGFFTTDNSEQFFTPNCDGVRKYTSNAHAKKVKADRVAQCFTLTCWGPALDFQAIGQMIEDVEVLKPEIAELNDRHGRSLLRTVVGDRYILTHAVTIEPAFPTKYIRELMRLGYDVHYIDSEQEQLDALRTLAEAKNEEVLEGTSH